MSDEPTNIKARGRDGRFLPGTKCGGRLPRVREEAYLKVTINACSEDDWNEIILKAVKQAKNGSDKARTFLAKYLLPRPAPSSSPLVNLNFAGGSPMPTPTDIDAAIEQRIREIFGQPAMIDVTPDRGIEPQHSTESETHDDDRNS